MSGLLQMATLLSQNKGVAFNNFIEKNSISFFSVFSQYETYFYVSQSIGLNGESILKSFSTLDFWEGTIPEENKVYNFSLDENNLYPFLQFFSEDIQESLNSLSIIKKADKIYLLGNKNFDQSLIEKLSTLEDSKFAEIKKDNNYSCFSINFEQAIENYIKENLVEDFLSVKSKLALINEISNQLLLNFSNIGFVNKVSDFEFLLNFKNELNIDLLKTHLSNSFKIILGKSASFIEINN